MSISVPYWILTNPKRAIVFAPKGSPHFWSYEEAKKALDLKKTNGATGWEIEEQQQWKEKDKNDNW